MQFVKVEDPVSSVENDKRRNKRHEVGGTGGTKRRFPDLYEDGGPGTVTKGEQTSSKGGLGV